MQSEDAEEKECADDGLPSVQNGQRRTTVKSHDDESRNDEPMPDKHSFSRAQTPAFSERRYDEKDSDGKGKTERGAISHRSKLEGVHIEWERAKSIERILEANPDEIDRRRHGDFRTRSGKILCNHVGRNL